MAERNDSEGEADSNLKMKNIFSDSYPRASRSLSNSGRKKHSFIDNLSGRLTRVGSLDIQEFSSQNESRAVAFDTVCQHLGTLHDKPLSLCDWERFKEWCDHDRGITESTTQTSSETVEVYRKCRMVLVDIFGKMPAEDEWMAGKDWYMARHQGSFRSKKVHDQREDKYHTGDIPMDTSERQRESEVDQLKKKIDNLQKQMEQVQEKNKELSRRGPLPLIGMTNEGAREQMDEERSSNDNRREQKKEELQMKCDQLTREITYRDEEINKMKSSNGKLSDRVNVLEKECGQMYLDMKNQDHQIEREKSNNKILQQRMEETNDQFNYNMNCVKHKLASKDNEIQRLEEEKADALRRLSTLASAKLSDNNPDITDLSDMNRPQKIAEKYSELYDNEWTDAYEYLTANGQDHQKTVADLLNVLKGCFQYCKTVGRRQYEHLLVMACSPSFEQKDQGLGAVGNAQAVQTYGQTITQKVIELRKVAFQHSLNTIKQAYQTDRGRDIDQSTSQEISIYMDKCLDVSWLACIQDPPLEIVSDFPPYSRVDLNIVRKYTKSGEFVEYVIWPALLLSNNGGLLSKGVVQCTSRPHDVGAQQMRRPSDSNQESDF
ncbi:uncharacterized protein LOC110454831 isoform X2 [Mizuhopecten yessoensis]|uniref:uncharacterized protein LOC110454831 isoform X2 n=1 Tax=Mizuhopecten yessoensis TaxID=6573 RepID=UPI000B45AE8C|nr:uncharacterized protein LOC110454831 isoform X2 [Mizuhopecten yessoensis]